VKTTDGEKFTAGEVVLVEKEEAVWVRAEYLSFEKSFGHIVRLAKPEIRFVLTVPDGGIRKLRA